MKIDRVFVLLLVVMLPMTGCFDDAVGEADAQGDTSDDTTDSGTNTGTETSQSRIWYSSAGSYNDYWNDGQINGYISENGTSSTIRDNGERCVAWGPYYNSSTGEYVGEECTEFRRPTSPSDWNLTDCTENNGEVIWPYTDEQYENWNQYYEHAPDCRLHFTTINTSVGQALLIYEWSYFSITSTCDGVSVYTGSGALSGKEYVIAPGTALSCSHELYTISDYTYSEHQIDYQRIWSIVYAVQETTVV